MKIEGTYTFQAPQKRVWEVLNNPEELAKALPGCEKLVETDPGKFDLQIRIGIAAVKGSYKGKLEIAEPQPPDQVILRGEGKGLPGYVKGEAQIRLSRQGDGTVVFYSGDMQVGGLLAGIGQRLIIGAAKMMLGARQREGGPASPPGWRWPGGY
jgi:carbon monoxide dehydrogenase subunit G